MLEPVIGLEIHLALKTHTKMFCGCSADAFGEDPNVNTCPVCLGLPGALPVVNVKAIEKAIMFSLAIQCTVPNQTQFHRKNYYYPDAPKNYQISQFDQPVGEHGYIKVEGKRIGITRCHVEEDAGRLVHPPYADHSLVDLNRAGAPLIEMVTEPDLRTPEQARSFLNQVRAIAQALEVSDALPEEGKMRADVNVSLRRPEDPYGTKVEIKNLNSFKSVKSSLEYEIRRQTTVLEVGRLVHQETRGWNEGGQKTYTMRAKEETADYRYFPDPDLPLIRIEDKQVESIRANTPELPDQKRARYLELELKQADAEMIAYDMRLSRFYDAAVELLPLAAQALANWLVSEVLGYLNNAGEDLDTSALTPIGLVSLVRLVENGTISGRVAKEILPAVMAGRDPENLVKERGLTQITDVSTIEQLVDTILQANPEIVASITENPKAINALLGRVLQASRGQAKPDLVRTLLIQKLDLE
jgi:aspartyl-tRNA(Asn)/glutamyl-tRNA(Gln) amidotransferase subunit B